LIVNIVPVCRLKTPAAVEKPATLKPEPFICFGERGRLDRRFRRLAENSWSARLFNQQVLAQSRQIGRRDTGQGDRDGRALKSNCIFG